MVEPGDVNIGASAVPPSGRSSATAPLAAGRRWDVSLRMLGRQVRCGAGSNPNGSGAATYSYVYALGHIEPRFPRLGVEKEFAQVTGRAQTSGLTDRQALHAVLSEPAEPVPRRQLLDLHHRGPRNIHPATSRTRGTSPNWSLRCGRHQAQWTSTSSSASAAQMPRRNSVTDSWSRSLRSTSCTTSTGMPSSRPSRGRTSCSRQFEAAAPGAPRTDPADGRQRGATDEHRATNFLAVRYPAIYALAASGMRRTIH